MAVPAGSGEMSKQLKAMVLNDIRQRVGGVKDFVVVDVSKLDGPSANKLRLDLRKQDIRMFGVKNTLAVKTFAESGFKGNLDDMFKGPSTVVIGGRDIVQLTKEVLKQTKGHKALQVKGGVVEGTAVTGDQVDSISKGPSREELVGRIVMLMLSPGAALAGALLGPGGTVCGAVKSIAEKEEAPAEAPAA
jgi:large subunit ribosomal protein L10